MKFINPGILAGTGYATVEELSLSDGWCEVVERELADFSRRHPDVRVVIVDRDGRIIGESA